MKILTKSLLCAAAFFCAAAASAAPTAQTPQSTSAGTATASAVAKDDFPMFFMVKAPSGAMVIVRESELDRPAVTNMSGGAKAVSFNGSTYDVDSTIVSRYGHSKVIDRSMVMMLDDIR